MLRNTRLSHHGTKNSVFVVLNRILTTDGLLLNQPVLQKQSVQEHKMDELIQIVISGLDKKTLAQQIQVLRHSRKLMIKKHY